MRLARPRALPRSVEISGRVQLRGCSLLQCGRDARGPSIHGPTSAVASISSLIPSAPHKPQEEEKQVDEIEIERKRSDHGVRTNATVG